MTNDAERWARVSAILAHALDLPARQRTRYLADACDSDPALRTEVLAFFEELRGTETFLEHPPAVMDRAAGAPTTFGPYSVVRPLGEGGMGVVYLASRNDGQFTRQVAIKRVGSMAPGPELLRRFRAEREILARLDHPNISRLLDAGVDALGVPYLVMEYVDGVPLTAHCRGRRLPLRDRLALYLQVCTAVQHAHQNLVIHRDIKPGNILVSAEGETKLLDFGIATLLDSDAGRDDTRTVNRALSLDYASPEQVRGDPVTTASDVYSLGVLLYELLAGVRPYDAGSESLTEALRLICEEVPPPPSRVAPVEGRGALAGDLDAIVGKAMEKAPGDRYGSVAELAADLRAHLEHLPLKARPASVGYVVRKFARRHRMGTAVAAGVVSLVLAGIGAVLWQAQIAQRERRRAETRFQEVRELATFVIYDLQDAVSKLAGSTDLRRTMVQRSIDYLDSLATDAAADRALQLELAGGYLRLGTVLGHPGSANLGDTEGALASYAKARAIYDRILANGPDNETRRRLARLLFQLRYVHTDPDTLGELLEELMAIWEDLVRAEPESEENLNGLAAAHFSAFGRLGAPNQNQSVAHMERALEIYQQLLQAQPHALDRKRNVALCHKYLSTYFASADPARSLGHAVEAARLDAERLAAEPDNAQAKLDYSFDLGTLGDYYFGRQAYDEALRHYEEVLRLRRDLWDADRSNVHLTGRLAYTLARLGETQVLAGQPRQAIRALEESVARIEEMAEDRRDVSTASTLLLAYAALGTAALATRGDPCAWDARAADLLRSTPSVRQAVDDQILRWLDSAAVRAVTCHR